MTSGAPGTPIILELKEILKLFLVKVSCFTDEEK
jgi:hypothetical protein